MLLDKIEKANDIKKIDKSDYGELAEEIRQFLIQKISVTGGHLGSNLGAVELTMALHLALNLPEDKIIWDVGHQSYTHKILTGRKDGFDVLRQFHGMSGFPKRKESSYDAFDTGHSSTSISAGLGLVKARDLKGEKTTIVSVIGDGSLTGGMAYEALNNAAKLETNFIVILNDNNMSISENVGGVSKYLNNIRTATGYLDLKEGIYNALKSKPGGDGIVNRLRRAKSSFKQLVIPGMFFEDMGVTYLGPVDGHDIEGLIKVIEEAKRVKGAVLIHVLTQKGKGYGPAEKHPARFHGAEPFDIETGIPSHPRTVANYTDVFSTVMCKLGQRDERVVAITAAMPDGTGLKRFRNMYPDRFFDVGIAEEHAVTFAAGLAAGGMKPIVAVYSSFLQRAYDQILHDVCIQNLPVVFAIDRKEVLAAYDLGHKIVDGEPISELLDGQDPDKLFVERDISYLKDATDSSDGGRMVIVLPKQNLSGANEDSVEFRKWLLKRVQITAVIDLPREAFQPHTGTKTSLIFLKKVKNIPDSYPVFMAVSEAVGHDRRGLSLYKKDDNGNDLLDDNNEKVIWNDLPEILAKYKEYEKRGSISDTQNGGPSCFVIDSQEILSDPARRIDAWYWDPNKNNIAKQLEESVGDEIKEIVRLGDLVVDNGIFYPGRHKRNYVEPGDNSVPFYSGTQILQVRPFDIKYQPKDYTPARKHFVEKDWILITRSGSTGRVVMVTDSMAGTMVTEHVIRVICDPELIDPYYVYAYLATEDIGKVLLEKGIYASVVDHITPEFVATIPVPRLAPEREKEIADRVRQAEKMRDQANKDFVFERNQIEKIMFENMKN